MVNCLNCGKEIGERSTYCYSCSKLGERNPNWKGETVGLNSLHQWLKTHNTKPKLCERCKKASVFDLANKTGHYTRNIEDYEWLCRKCHIGTDGRYKNLKNQNFEWCDRCEEFINPKTHPCFQKMEECPRCKEMVNPETHQCFHKKAKRSKKK